MRPPNRSNDKVCKIGCSTNMIKNMGKVISVGLKAGVDPKTISEQLDGIKYPKGCAECRIQVNRIKERAK